MIVEWPFETVLDEIDDITSADKLLDIAFTTLKSVDVTQFIYAFLPQDTHYHEDVIEFLHRGFSGDHLVFPKQFKAFARTDAGAKYLKLKAASSIKPFSQRDHLAELLFETTKPVSAADAAHWERRDGLFIPVHSANSNTGFFCLPHPIAGPDSKRERKLQLLCQSIHQKYCELLRLPEGRQIKLSDRELDILLWMTLGKSNGVIADILGLSKHTIDSYLRRLFLKLDVNDRVSASIKAYEIGLLHEDIIRTSKAYLPQIT